MEGEKNIVFGWDFTSKCDRRVELNKNGNVLHWNFPKRKYVIDKPLPNMGFQWASNKQPFFMVCHESNLRKVKVQD